MTIPERVERCGYTVQRAQSIFTDNERELPVRISNGTIWFHLPESLYDDLDDEAFLSICATKTRQIMSKAPGTHAPGAISRRPPAAP